MPNFPMRSPHIEKYFPRWHFSRKKYSLFTVASKKESVAVCGYRIVVCRDLKIFQIFPVCVCQFCIVVCGGFENLQRSFVHGMCSLVLQLEELENHQTLLSRGVWDLYW